MQTVIVTSTNPVKIEATRAGFAALFPAQDFHFEGLSADSGVSPQPMSYAETLQGARNRIASARRLRPGAACYVGIEGGVEDTAEGMEVFAWVVVQAGRLEAKARTAVFYLPQEVAGLVRQGYELGAADDIVFGRQHSKQQNGAVGLLTADAVTRASYYTQAVILALIPFKNPGLDFRRNGRRR